MGEENGPQHRDIGDCEDKAIPLMKGVIHMGINVSQH